MRLSSMLHAAPWATKASSECCPASLPVARSAGPPEQQTSVVLDERPPLCASPCCHCSRHSHQCLTVRLHHWLRAQDALPAHHHRQPQDSGRARRPGVQLQLQVDAQQPRQPAALEAPRWAGLGLRSETRRGQFGPIRTRPTCCRPRLATTATLPLEGRLSWAHWNQRQAGRGDMLPQLAAVLCNSRPAWDVARTCPASNVPAGLFAATGLWLGFIKAPNGPEVIGIGLLVAMVEVLAAG
jgi:hypothetical protein